MKLCTKCKIEKDEFEFTKSKLKKDGLNCWCKKCVKEYKINNKNKISEKSTKYRINNKEKIKKIHKNYYFANKDEISKKYKKHYINNKDKYSENHKEYYINNKKQLLEKSKNYIKQRRKIDPIFKLRMNISRMINISLKKQDSSKFGKSILQYLPYTISELKQHIESQWENWMTLNNHGRISNNKRTWQIDHIIPQSKLPYISMEEYNFQKCWALKNLRPLESFANLKKKNKIEPK